LQTRSLNLPHLWKAEFYYRVYNKERMGPILRQKNSVQTVLLSPPPQLHFLEFNSNSILSQKPWSSQWSLSFTLRNNFLAEAALIEI